MSFSQSSSASLTRLAKCFCYYGAKKNFPLRRTFRLYFHSSSGNQGINVFLGNGNGIEIGKLIDELARDHRVFVGSFFKTAARTLSLSVRIKSIERFITFRKAVISSGAVSAFRLLVSNTENGNLGMTLLISKRTGKPFVPALTAP